MSPGQVAELASRIATISSDTYALILIDIDNFELINQCLGQAAADQLLVSISQRLDRVLEHNAVATRHYCDQFLVLPFGESTRRQAERIAGRAMKIFDQPFLLNGREVFSSASIGIAFGNTDSQAIGDTVRDAYAAARSAKSKGKSQTITFSPSLRSMVNRRFMVGNELRHALNRKEFQTYFQTIVNVSTEQIVGYEALARWRHPIRGVLEPREFMEIAEEEGILTDIGWSIIEQSCCYFSRLMRLSDSSQSPTININIDRCQLVEKKFIHRLIKIIQDNYLDPTQVALEVTEKVFLGPCKIVRENLVELKRLGFSMVVDDFGIGYSSLALFASLPFDALKIDRTFIQDLEHNSRHQALIRTINRFAQELDLGVTAEGVETLGQARMLEALGCLRVQGYFYSKPTRPERLSEHGSLLERKRRH